MTILYRLRALVRWLFRRDEIERALDTDLEDYIERSAAEKMRAGMTEAEARRAARIELGGVEQTKDSVRATLALGRIETFIADAGYALRTMRRQPTFSIVGVLTLALGIGVNVALFSLFQQLLQRPLPVAEPDELVNLTDPGPKMVGQVMASSSVSGGGDTVFSYPTFRDLERAQQTFVGLAAHRPFEANVSTGESARLTNGVLVSGSYFSVLGLRPALGRLLGPQDDLVDESAESAVLSYAYWQSELASDPNVLGRTLLVNGVPLAVVGVAPPGFSGMAVGTRASVFVPITNRAAGPPNPDPDSRLIYWVHLVARLKPGVTREEAAAAMAPLYRAIVSDSEAPLLTNVDEQDLEAFRTRPLVLESGARGQTHSRTLVPARGSLEMLLAACGAVLLLCCTNVAGLVMVRGAARNGEMAVRATMGASRGRIASLLLAESLTLALPAAVLSLPVALLTIRIASGVPGIPAAGVDVELSVAAMLVAVGAAVASALAFGLFPLRNLIRIDPGKALQTYSVRQTSSRGVTRFRAALATVQIALSMALLVMTGVFGRTLANIGSIDLKLDIDSVVMLTVSPVGRSGEAAAALYQRLDEELEAMPGVSAVASSTVPLLSIGGFEGQVSVEGLEPKPLPISWHPVSPEFLEMFGIELLAGRGFGATDIGKPIAVVNQRFAEQAGLGRDVLGRKITGINLEIVGLVADAKVGGKVTGDVGPRVFSPIRNGSTFYIRGNRAPEELLDAVRETVVRVDPTAPITRLVTMEQQLLNNIAVERFIAGASSAFAVLGTVLAALGIYGVLAYAVAQRSREIGLRLALGAPAGRIRGMVVRQVVMMALVGLSLGVVAVLPLGGAARSLLFGVEPYDPIALAGAAVVLAAVVLGAAYFPARRASRVDPMSVLRYE